MDQSRLPAFSLCGFSGRLGSIFAAAVEYRLLQRSAGESSLGHLGRDAGMRCRVTLGGAHGPSRGLPRRAVYCEDTGPHWLPCQPIRSFQVPTQMSLHSSNPRKDHLPLDPAPSLRSIPSSRLILSYGCEDLHSYFHYFNGGLFP